MTSKPPAGSATTFPCVTLPSPQLIVAAYWAGSEFPSESVNLAITAVNGIPSTAPGAIGELLATSEDAIKRRSSSKSTLSRRLRSGPRELRRNSNGR